jgi:hypothetical protein
MGSVPNTNPTAILVLAADASFTVQQLEELGFYEGRLRINANGYRLSVVDEADKEDELESPPTA